jgi:hypothetical protein
VGKCLLCADAPPRRICRGLAKIEFGTHVEKTKVKQNGISERGEEKSAVHLRDDTFSYYTIVNQYAVLVDPGTRRPAGSWSSYRMGGSQLWHAGVMKTFGLFRKAAGGS